MTNSINSVFQRIETIERRFGLKTGKGSDFSSQLSMAQEQAEKNLQQTADSNKIIGVIQDAARQHGVDPCLAVAVAKAESGLSTAAISPAGAVGVMQLMPETAAAMGVKNIYDPRQNIDGGVRYLRQMLDSFGGDPEKAIAAYNAGPDAVIRYGNVPPYKETQNYVARVKTLY